ncbi:MAG: hypothetical protein COU33_02905, partial [Candidatus Magasanikbacteria bacterium CG10_big_fil_rev_8_21_14_0_10_43_6]
RYALLTAAAIFLYVGFFFGPEGTLLDTELFLTIQEMYPSWTAFTNDMLVGLLLLVGVSFFIHTILKLEHRYSKKSTLYRLTKKLDVRVIRNALDALSVIARWSISLFVAITTLWLLRELGMFYTPMYYNQPVVYGIAVLGLVCLFESFTFWQRKLHSLFCFRTKM